MCEEPKNACKEEDMARGDAKNEYTICAMVREILADNPAVNLDSVLSRFVVHRGNAISGEERLALVEEFGKQMNILVENANTALQVHKLYVNAIDTISFVVYINSGKTIAGAKKIAKGVVKDDIIRTIRMKAADYEKMIEEETNKHHEKMSQQTES